MNKKQKVSLIGLVISIFVFLAGFISVGIIGEMNTATFVITPLVFMSFHVGIVFMILLIIFSVKKESNAQPKKEQSYMPPQPKSDVDNSKKQETENNEERTFKEGLKRTPWYIWVITISFTLIGTFLLIIPPIGLMCIGLGFVAFWLPYRSWKTENIRAPWPSGELTHEKIVIDLHTHQLNSSIISPSDYRIVEDVVLKTNYSITDDYTPTTITFKNSGTFKIKSSMFQKYYSPVEIAVNIQQGEGVYLIFSNETDKLEFVYRKIYCTL